MKDLIFATSVQQAIEMKRNLRTLVIIILGQNTEHFKRFVALIQILTNKDHLSPKKH